MLRAVLFDLDDTLVDHASSAATAITLWAAEQGIDDPQIGSRWTSASEVHYARYQRRELTFTEQGRERVRAVLSAELDDEMADRLYRGYLRHYEAAWRVFDDAVPALRRARAAGLTVAVLTNGDQDHQWLKAQAVGIDREIDTFLASSILPASKPEVAAFRSAAEVVGVRPDEALMIGNSLVQDVQGALSAGLRAVLLDRHRAHAETGVPVVQSLNDLTFPRSAAARDRFRPE